MQYPLSLDQIKARTQALRLPIGELCRLADVAVSTVLRKGTRQHRRGTIRDLGSALETFERQQRDYLLTLHPVSQDPKLVEAAAGVADEQGQRPPQ